MLSTLGRGGDGQKIRDEILNIMHRHHIKEVKGTWMEVRVGGSWVVGLRESICCAHEEAALGVLCGSTRGPHLSRRAALRLTLSRVPQEWHQKLHNNTTPDDIPICEAYIAFLQANGDNGAYWRVLSDAGITRQRLESFDRAIRCEPEVCARLAARSSACLHRRKTGFPPLSRRCDCAWLTQPHVRSFTATRRTA